MCLNKIKQLFLINSNSQLKPLKTIKELDILDDVWIKDKSGNIYKGWIFYINKHHLIAVVSLENNQSIDFRFNITRPLTQTEIIQGKQILYLNEPCTLEKSSTFQSKKDI